MLDSNNHLTLKLPKNHVFGVKKLKFCHIYYEVLTVFIYMYYVTIIT